MSARIRISDKRQRAAIEAFARANGYELIGEYYDAAVSGADPIDRRPGFMEMLRRVASNGAKIIIVELPDRFARDLIVQLTGHDVLKAEGIESEWEHAARAGTGTQYSFGDDEFKLGDYAWFGGMTGNSDQKTHSVRQKAPRRVSRQRG